MSRPLNQPKLAKGEDLTLEQAFALVLREKRLARGLTQEDLEGKGMMSTAQVSRLEQGKRQVCLRGIVHLAEKLDVDVGDLMREVVKRARTTKG